MIIDEGMMEGKTAGQSHEHEFWSVFKIHRLKPMADTKNALKAR